MQVFLAVLAREYDWECDPTEKWITAENLRYAGVPTHSAPLFDSQSSRKKRLVSPGSVYLGAGDSFLL